MKLPQLQTMPKKQSQNEYQQTFYGLNLRRTAGPQEFADQWNMGSSEFPAMAPRRPRRLIRKVTAGTTLLGGDTLSWVDGGALYIGGEKITDGLSDEATLIRMGAYMIVWPDKVIYNTHTGTLSRMDHTWRGDTVHARPCMISGQDLAYVAQEDAPESPRDGMYWLNTASNGLYQYLGGVWTGIDTVYTRLEALDLGAGFGDYDVVSISGMDYENFNLEAATVYARGDGYIVIATGEIVDIDISGDIVIRRAAPELDAIVESGNRLWGYSNKTHEIRGSKLGDPTNWNSYLGISTDSYAATVGSVGDFTGICAYHGYVHFWKEDRLHRLYGTMPSNFQLVETQMRGVMQGCGRSLCVVDELLCYMSRDGMLRYDGSAPISLQEPLGDLRMTDVICGGHQSKLYVSAITDNGPRMLVFDTRRGVWHMEDDARAVGFASTEEGDFFLDDQGNLWGIDGAGSALETADAQDEEPISWRAVTGDMMEQTTMIKVLRELSVRLQMERDARIEVEVQYNSDGKWIRLMDYSAGRKKTATLPIHARECDHMAVRYTGRGETVLYALNKIYDVRDGNTCLSYRA